MSTNETKPKICELHTHPCTNRAVIIVREDLPAPTPPAGAEPSPEGLCIAQKILTHDRQLRERTNGHDACYPEEAAIWIDAAFAPLRAELEDLRKKQNLSDGEWATLMADVHDYFAEEKADRGKGRVRLVLTLLGQLRIQRDEARAALASSLNTEKP